MVGSYGFCPPPAPAHFHVQIEFPFMKQNEEEDHAMQTLLLFWGCVSQPGVPARH